jgi:antiphage defense system Thoeris ThsB-like protein
LAVAECLPAARSLPSLSRTFCDQYEVFHDTSLERAIDSDNTDYVRWRLAEKCITGSSCTIVLIGRETWGRKFVDWEIDATLERQHGLIGVMLPPDSIGLLSPFDRNSVPPRLQDNVQSGYAVVYSWNEVTASAAALKQAIELANSRPQSLINNDRSRCYRNASFWETA